MKWFMKIGVVFDISDMGMNPGTMNPGTKDEAFGRSNFLSQEVARLER